MLLDIVSPSAPGHQMGTTVQTQRTDLQQRLDADFDRMFPVALPAITPPLTPAQLAEGDLTAELR